MSASTDVAAGSDRASAPRGPERHAPAHRRPRTRTRWQEADALIAGWASRPWTARQVWSVGVTMVLVQLCFRAWIVYPAWFFLDDYLYLVEAREGLSVSYLLSPYSGHLMPGARLLAWVVAESGQLAWPVAATASLLMQAVASLACLWCLIRLFGPRPGLLVPLGLYLTTALSVPGYVWWAAAMNQLPVQAVLFVAVAAWVEHLRSARWSWLGLTLVAVAAGMFFDVRGALVLPVLAFVAAAWFASGGPVRRVRHLARHHLRGFAMLFVLGAVYSAVYVSQVDQVTDRLRLSALLDIAATMLGQSLPTAVVGGPWRWDASSSPPTATADPPLLLVAVSWAVVVAIIVVAALLRTRTLRAWALVATYVVVLTVLVTSARSGFGSVIGREYRFLTEAACLVALAVALAFFELPGAVESSAPRPRSRVRVRPSVVAALVALMVAGGLISSASYARIWHTSNASQPYLERLASDVQQQGPVDVADTPVREDVLSQLVAPRNTTRSLASLVSDDVSFPAVSHQLAVVGDDGSLSAAMISLGVASPAGPLEGCGWRVISEGTVPLEGQMLNIGSWVRVGYLATATTPVRVTLGDTTVRTEVRQGLGNLYLRTEGGFDEVRFDSLDPTTTLCVDRVEVGQPVPGGPL